MAHFSHKTVEPRPHHVKQKISGTRARYREGRRLTAVKAYTVGQESCCLLVQGVPAVGAENDFQYLCEQYGEMEFHRLDEYACEEFTETYLVKYYWFPAARTAKKHLDDKSFLGGILHVCYAPEYESVQDTSQKLQERRKYVSSQLRNEKGCSKIGNMLDNSKNMNTETTAAQLAQNVRASSGNNSIIPVNSYKPVTYIWAGKEYTVYPQSVPNTNNSDSSAMEPKKVPVKSFVPRQVMQKASVMSHKGDSTEAVCEKPTELNGLPSVNIEVQKLSVPNIKVSLKRRKVM